MQSWASAAGFSPGGLGGAGEASSKTRRPSIFAIPRFDFCLAPPREQHHHTAATSSTSTGLSASAAAPRGGAQPSLGLCGAPLCTGLHMDTELSVVRVPHCDVPRCDVPRCNGGCAAGAHESDLPDPSELSIVQEPMAAGSLALQRNLQLAKAVVRDIFAELEARCLEERSHYDEAGSVPSRQKSNTWAVYTSKVRLEHFVAESFSFVRHNADCRMRQLSAAQLRFLVLLQHFVSEDTSDFYRPESHRKHADAFEGVLTDGVNSQLVKDAHRSEFSVEGRSFSLHDSPQDADGLMHEERREEIAKFQSEFVMALETFLLAYCGRRGLSPLGTRRLVQCVTTQMSQAGLANLDRGSQATRYFVGSQGLDQRTAYNLSSMFTPDHGESLKLSILCMKTGFCQYLEREELLRDTGVDAPKRCKPTSYLYQYATLRFSPGPPIDNCESTICTLLDALDEAHIDPISKGDSGGAGAGARAGAGAGACGGGVGCGVTN